MINKIKLSYWYRLLATRYQKYVVKKNPIIEMNRAYNLVYHRNIDFKNPVNLIEKIYWLQLYTDTSLWTICADKYRVREYVQSCGVEFYLPQLLGNWDDSSKINFDCLPSSFVLKTNNGCGTCIVVKDKSIVNQHKIKKQLCKWLKVPYGYSGAQLHYTRIKPCIIAEELLDDGFENHKFSPNSIVDYKVWCINGIPESVLIVYDRTKQSYCLDLYDTDWIRKKDCLKLNDHYEFRETEIPKPVCLDEMLEIASKLAKPFPEVRVDFYVVNNKPVIGELTFTTGYGYFTDEYYEYLGSKIDLSKVKKLDKINK